MSARMPFTVFLLATLFEKMLQPGHALLPSPVQLGKPQSLQPNLFLAVLPRLSILFVELFLVLPVILFDERDLLTGEGWNPADDLVVSSPFLEIGNEVQHGDPAGGKLRSPAIVNDLNRLGIHAFALPRRGQIH